MFIPTTAQQFNTKLYTIIQQASYMFQPFSAIIREAKNQKKKKKNLTTYDMDVQLHSYRTDVKIV